MRDSDAVCVRGFMEAKRQQLKGTMMIRSGYGISNAAAFCIAGLMSIYVNAATVVDPTPVPTKAQAESPTNASIQSGVGLIRGWACEANEVTISIDGGAPIPIAYGTSRADTKSVCGDENNGYGMVIAWGVLGNGWHRLQTYVDGNPVGPTGPFPAEFTVYAIGSGFETGLEGEYVLNGFPAQGQSVRITWSEADQNFIVTGVNTGAGFASVGTSFTTTSPRGNFPMAEAQVGGASHESPAQHTIQSGVGLVRGWACDAQSVEISIDKGARIPVAYGTSRADTQGVCGDSDNGYGMVIAWGLLGNGVHRLQTYIDGVEISDVEFEVVAIGSGFETGLAGEYTLPDFPSPGDSVVIRWSQPDQNFKIIASSTPPALQHLSVSAGFSSALVSWADPHYPLLDHYEIWRLRVTTASDNYVGRATLVGTSVAPSYSDQNLDRGTKYLYWVRAVSKSGIPGPFNEQGLTVTTQPAF